jgi:hypothetical protein
MMRGGGGGRMGGAVAGRGRALSAASASRVGMCLFSSRPPGSSRSPFISVPFGAPDLHCPLDSPHLALCHRERDAEREREGAFPYGRRLLAPQAEPRPSFVARARPWTRPSPPVPPPATPSSTSFGPLIFWPTVITCARKDTRARKQRPLREREQQQSSRGASSPPAPDAHPPNTNTQARGRDL